MVPIGADECKIAHQEANRALRNVPRISRSRVHDDVHSDALLALVHASRDYNPDLGVPFPAYAHTVIRYRVVDSLRRHLGNTLTAHRRRPQTHHLTFTVGDHDDPETMLDAVLGPRPDPACQEVEDRLADQQALTRVVDWARTHLTPHSATTIERRLHGWTLAEIGRANGSTESAACLALNRALAKVREAGLEPP